MLDAGVLLWVGERQVCMKLFCMMFLVALLSACGVEVETALGASEPPAVDIDHDAGAPDSPVVDAAVDAPPSDDCCMVDSDCGEFATGGCQITEGGGKRCVSYCGLAQGHCLYTTSNDTCSNDPCPGVHCGG